jgi:hypothetical protein
MAKEQVESVPKILQSIAVLEGLENLMDIAPDAAIEDILIQAWSKVSDTFPEDFQQATQQDAGAEGLRRYLRVKAFFEDPAQGISQDDLVIYHQNRALPIDDCAEFFFNSEQGS